jgi:hypothetical protein
VRYLAQNVNMFRKGIIMYHGHNDPSFANIYVEEKRDSIIMLGIYVPRPELSCSTQHRYNSQQCRLELQQR